MADERIGLVLDLGPSIPSAKEFAAALQSISITASANAAPALKQLDAQTKAAEKASADFGRGIQSISFAVQDFTSVLGSQGLGRALGSIQNNIPQILTGLGAGAGLAGVVSLAAIAVGQLVDNWGSIEKLWKDSKAAEETKRLEELATAADKAREAIEKQLKTPSKEQLAPGERINAAIKEFGGPAVEKEIKDALFQRQGSFGPEADKRFAQNLIHNVQIGDRKSIDFLNEIGANNDSDVFRRIRGQRTAQEDRTFVFDAEQKHREEGVKREKEEKEKAAKEKEKADRDAGNLVDQLNAQGAQNQADFDKEYDKELAERHARNEAIAQQNAGRASGGKRGGGTPTIDQARAGLESKISGFEQDALAERARGVVNGPAEQAYRAATAQLQQLLGTIVQNQGEMANQMNQFAHNFENINQGARKVETRMNRLR